MCRAFSADPVAPEVVDRLLDRARRAPSAGHTQGWSFLVLEGPAQTARFWTAAAQPEWLARPTLPGLVRAPVIVVPYSSARAYEDRYAEPDKAGAAKSGPDRSGPDRPGSPLTSVPYDRVDLSFAVMLLLLGAVAEGLGALFFRLRDGAEGRLREEFAVPGDWRPLGAVALGHPSPEGTGPAGSAGRGRRPLGEIVHRGGW